MQNKERKLKDDIEAMRLDQEEKIKKENEMDDLKLSKEYKNARDELENL